MLPRPFVILWRALIRIPGLGRLLDLLSTFAAIICRLSGPCYAAKGLPGARRPQKMLKLYEFEGCPFCRKVREALSVLDLDAEIYPCPRVTLKSYGAIGESRFRQQVLDYGGKLSFPFLVDPNKIDAGKPLAMNGSDDIVKYLWSAYAGDARPRLITRISQTFPVSLGIFLSSGFRPLPEHGMLRTPSKRPNKSLELWSVEGSPFCKIVTETLSTLELPYVLHNMPKLTGLQPNKRDEWKKRFGDRLSAPRKAIGAVQIPFLIDPNTGTEIFESADIRKYLFNTYAIGETVDESLLNYSTQGATADHFTVFQRKRPRSD